MRSTGPLNSHPEFLELEDVELAQGSGSLDLLLNVGVRFGVPEKDLDGVTVESGIVSARLIVSAINCRLRDKFSNTRAESAKDVRLSRKDRKSSTDETGREASFGITSIGLNGTVGMTTARLGEATSDYETKIVEIQAEAGNAWTIRHVMRNFIRGLVLGHDAPLCVARVQDSFRIELRLVTYPGNIEVRRADGESIPKEKKKLLAAIQANSLGKDAGDGSITLARAIIERMDE